jgi:phage N-6-adenine-methyltransferase
MAKGCVDFSNDNEYYTPKALVDFFGPFAYDPATTSDKAAELGIPYYSTIETDGLCSNWLDYGSIWINPPFTHKHLFLNKAVETYRKTKAHICILLPIEFLTTHRFHNSGATGRLFIPKGRIRFQSGLGKDSRAPAFGTVVLRLEDSNSVELLDISELR